MKLLILGATGVVGGWTTRKATLNKHDVTIYVRNEEKVPEDIRNSGVKIIQGKLSDKALLSSAIQNQDAILSAIGPTSFYGFAGEFVGGYRTILELMREHNVRRILAMGTISSYDHAHDSFALSRWLAYWLVFFVARMPQKEILGVEKVFREEGQGLDWTLYRVGGLGNSKQDGKVAEAGWVGVGSWRNFLERRDWANWLVQEAEREHPWWIREMPAIYTPKK